MTTATTVSTATSASSAADAPRAEDAQPKHETLKRQKTWGEKTFNWGTYGGIALLGNEAASLAITEAVKPGKRLHVGYQKFENWFKNLKSFTKADKSPVLHEYIVGNEVKTVAGELKPFAPRLPYLLLATVGGMLMVPFVKYAEAHKGEVVRKLDRKHYGTFSETDPKLVEAHKEMDEAPKQNWGSLWKGRFTTVIAAAAADFAFGWDHALSTKLFKNSEFSLNGISRATANTAAKIFKVGADNEKTFKKVVENGTWLLTLSSTLTVLFFASSKLFAKRQEQKIERKQEMRTNHMNGNYSDAAPEALEAPSPEVVDEKPVSEKPTPQVKSISREDTVATVPQLSQGA